MGKTTLAEKLGACAGSLFLRIDTINQGLRDFCSLEVADEGYRLAYRIAQENLGLGCSVIADSCNPIKQTRREWQEVATSINVNFENIEIICSDPAVHKHRVQTRKSTIRNYTPPSWPDVISREYEEWKTPHHVIDTANRTIESCFSELIQKISSSPKVAGN